MGFLSRETTHVVAGYVEIIAQLNLEADHVDEGKAELRDGSRQRRQVATQGRAQGDPKGHDGQQRRREDSRHEQDVAVNGRVHKPNGHLDSV